MSYPEGQYNVVKPASWADLVQQIARARSSDPSSTVLRGVELEPHDADLLAQRRKALGGTAYGASIEDFTVTLHQHPPDEFVIAVNRDGVVRLEPTDHKDHSKPAQASYYPTHGAKSS